MADAAKARRRRRDRTRYLARREAPPRSRGVVHEAAAVHAGDYKSRAGQQPGQRDVVVSSIRAIGTDSIATPVAIWSSRENADP